MDVSTKSMYTYNWDQTSSRDEKISVYMWASFQHEMSRISSWDEIYFERKHPIEYENIFRNLSF